METEIPCPHCRVYVGLGRIIQKEGTDGLEYTCSFGVEQCSVLTAYRNTETLRGEIKSLREELDTLRKQTKSIPNPSAIAAQARKH